MTAAGRPSGRRSFHRRSASARTAGSVSASPRPWVKPARTQSATSPATRGAESPRCEDHDRQIEPRGRRRGQEHVGVDVRGQLDELRLERDDRGGERLERAPARQQLAGEQPGEHDHREQQRDVREAHQEQLIEQVERRRRRVHQSAVQVVGRRVLQRRGEPAVGALGASEALLGPVPQRLVGGGVVRPRGGIREELERPGRRPGRPQLGRVRRRPGARRAAGLPWELATFDEPLHVGDVADLVRALQRRQDDAPGDRLDGRDRKEHEQRARRSSQQARHDAPGYWARERGQPCPRGRTSRRSARPSQIAARPGRLRE